MQPLGLWLASAQVIEGLQMEEKTMMIIIIPMDPVIYIILLDRPVPEIKTVQQKPLPVYDLVWGKQGSRIYRMPTQ